MEVFTPEKSAGLGVVWIVSSGGTSSREQALTESFEKRIGPLIDHGYVVFAVVHGNAPAFQLQDYVSDARRAVRFVQASCTAIRHRWRTDRNRRLFFRRLDRIAGGAGRQGG